MHETSEWQFMLLCFVFCILNIINAVSNKIVITQVDADSFVLHEFPPVSARYAAVRHEN